MGLVMAYGGAKELLQHARARRRLVRTSAVVVGVVDVGLFRANSTSYAARFRFTAADGRAVEAVSAASSFPGPTVGRQVPIVYDPADPEGSAERVGARRIQLALAPLMVAGGGTLTTWGASLG